MNLKNLKVGLKNSVAQVVTAQDTALAVGSGSLEVLATPKVLALIEKAAADLVEAHLPENLTSVGIAARILHLAPTPVGMEVRAEVEIIELDGRRIVFEFVAHDELDEIASGRHERFVVEREKFQSKANKKMVDKT